MACDLERRSSRVDILPGSPNQCHDSYQHQNTSEGHNGISLPGCALARISNILIWSCISDVLRSRIAQLLDNIPTGGRRVHDLSICTTHTSAGGTTDKRVGCERLNNDRCTPASQQRSHNECQCSWPSDCMRWYE